MSVFLYIWICRYIHSLIYVYIETSLYQLLYVRLLIVHTCNLSLHLIMCWDPSQTSGSFPRKKINVGVSSLIQLQNPHNGVIVGSFFLSFLANQTPSLPHPLACLVLPQSLTVSFNCPTCRSYHLSVRTGLPQSLYYWHLGPDSLCRTKLSFACRMLIDSLTFTH